MPLFHISILALVQGITELLPISSSGHLILVPKLTGWPDQGLNLDVAVHVGTLAAVMLYFWRDLWRMARGLARAARGRRDPGARLALHLIVATVPVVIVGYLVQDMVGSRLRSVEVIGWTTLGYGLLLQLVDRLALTVRRIEHVGTADALIIGIAQVLALVPGTSRSGITMTAARALGMERPDAARFSMLMAIPTIIAAGTLSGLGLYEAGDLSLTSDAAIAAGISFLAALVAIAVLMRWLRRATFTPFVVYRVLLGGGLLIWAYAF